MIYNVLMSRFDDDIMGQGIVVEILDIGFDIMLDTMDFNVAKLSLPEMIRSLKMYPDEEQNTFIFIEGWLDFFIAMSYPESFPNLRALKIDVEEEIPVPTFVPVIKRILN
jgi:hypothetical protein